jgi:phosphatidylglycerophosphatase A
MAAAPSSRSGSAERTGRLALRRARTGAGAMSAMSAMSATGLVNAVNAVRIAPTAIPRECGSTGSTGSSTGSRGSAGAGHASAEGAPGPPRGGAPRRVCALVLATAGGAGLAPVAPGTFGALVGVGLYALLAGRGPALLGLVLVAVSAAGIWAAGEAERVLGRRDDGRIVIDEVAGQLLGLWPLALLADPAQRLAPLALLAGFVAFRVLDIAKPFPVRWAERNLPGGLGVMGDDLLAGALTAALVALGALGGLAG